MQYTFMKPALPNDFLCSLFALIMTSYFLICTVIMMYLVLISLCSVRLGVNIISMKERGVDLVAFHALSICDAL